MKRIAIATVALAALCAPAAAADLPYKAAPYVASPSVIWYVGIGTEAGTEQVNVQGNNLFINSLASGDLRASGGAVTASVGFLSANPDRWYRCQATAAYQNIQGANAVIGSVASRWSATQECDIGFEVIQRITALLPNLGLSLPVFAPSLPANVLVAGAPRQYVGVLAKESGLSGQFFDAAGSDWNAAPGISTGYIWQTIDAAGKPGGLLDAYVNVSWPQKGFTVTGLGGAGAPVFTAGAKIGTQYTVGLRYDFLVSN